MVRREPGGETALSFAQSQLWFLDRMGADTAFNVPLAARLSGPLDVSCLERAFAEFGRRHEVLRTSFHEVGGRAIGRISATTRLRLERREAPVAPPELLEEAVLELGLKEAARPFDLARDPLVRALLVPLGEQRHALLMTMHHIVWDHGSTGLFFRELTALYEAFAAGRESPLPELSLHYGDYAAWQREWLSGDALASQMRFWRDELEGLETLDLPTDRGRPVTQGYETGVCDFDLPEQLTVGVKALGRAEGMTLAMLMLAVWQTVLHRYSAQTDIAVGLPVGTRSRVELEPMVGDFVNTLVMRNDLSGDPTFRELVRRVRTRAIDAFEHRELPFNVLVRELNPPRDSSRQPLFEVMFAFQNVRQETLRIGEVDVDPLTARRGTPEMQRPEAIEIAVDLELRVVEHADGLIGRLIYDEELFERSTIERMRGHLLQLLRGVVADPDTRLSRLPLIDAAERAQVLLGWNDTDRELSTEATVHQLFEAQVRRTPDSPALLAGGSETSFLDLDAAAERMARALRRRGVGPGVVVGLCLERSVEAVVAILATLKAGGAYAPLDPSHPVERLEFLLRDTATPVVVTRERWRAVLPDFGGDILSIDAAVEGEKVDGEAPRVAPATADDPLYVLYTSGSTGRPKGVVGLHRGAVNRIRWEHVEAPWKPGDVACHKTHLGFVDSVNELFSPLCAGTPVVVVPEAAVGSPSELLDLLGEHGVSRVTLTPSHTAALLGAIDALETELPALAHWTLSGEPLPRALATRLLNRFPRARLWNIYGSTEVSADASMHEVDRGELGPDGDVAIGRPIANVRLYVLDRALQPLPIGVPGELCVGGAGVARGYWKRPQMTSRSFVADPFADSPGARIYRTGDRARYRDDGTVELLGRLDRQVKIRGMRVEMGEIEATLASDPRVRRAVVIGRERIADRQLVGYVVPEPETIGATEEELLELARRRLPGFMVPTRIVSIDRLPKTPSGKLDHLALPAPERSRSQAPVGPTERKIAAIWRELLGIEQVGRFDHFVDLGGHSLLAVVALAKIEEELATRLRPADLLFSNLSQIAVLCERNTPGEADDGAPRSWLERISRTFRR